MLSQTNSPICDYLAEYEALTFDFLNMNKKISLTGVMPLYANTGFSETTDKATGNTIMVPWFHLVANYTSTYQMTDEKDGSDIDNNTSREMKIKISSQHMFKEQISGTELKQFFEEFFLGKKFLIIPTDGEKPQTENATENGKTYRRAMKNKFECTVSDTLNLKEFIANHKALLPKDKKDKK